MAWQPVSCLRPCSWECGGLAWAPEPQSPGGGEPPTGEVRQGERPDCFRGQTEQGTELGLLEPGVWVQVLALSLTEVNWASRFPL